MTIDHYLRKESRNNLFLTASIFILSMLSTSSHGQTTFQHTYRHANYNDLSTDLVEVGDGNYLMCGSAIDSGYQGEISLILIDSLGNLSKFLTFGAYDQNARSIVRSADGTFVVGGSADDSTGVRHICLMKTTASGDTSWIKHFGWILGESGVSSLIQTDDGGYAMTGYFRIGVSAALTAYLLKTDANGDFLWLNIFEGPLYTEGHSLIQTLDHGYVVCSRTDGSISRISMTKTDSAGNLLWSNHYDANTSNATMSVLQTSDSSLMILTTINYGGGEIMLVKTNSSGQMMWAKSYGAAGFPSASRIRQTSDGGFILVGSIYGLGAGMHDAYLIKTDSAGNVAWSSVYGGPEIDVAISVLETSDGGYILNGHSRSFGATGFDVYVIKTDSLGNAGCNQMQVHPSVTSQLPVDSPDVINVTGQCFTFRQPYQRETGGDQETFCSTGFEDPVSKNSVVLSPNPATDQFAIYGLEFTAGSVEIFNIVGKCLLKTNLESAHEGIKIGHLIPGIYFVNMITSNRRIVNKLIIE